MSEDYMEKVNPEHLDVLREVGNIGSGNAVTALSEMLGMEIDMSVPDAKILEFNEITNILTGPETLVTGLLVDMSGDLSGYILLILDLANAYELVSIAMGASRDVPESVTISDFDEMDISALTEIANILVGSYVSSICSLTNLRVKQSVPQVAMDMLGAIISIAAVEYGQIGDSVLFLRTKFSSIDYEIAGHFFLIPDYESYKILMKSLGMEL